MKNIAIGHPGTGLIKSFNIENELFTRLKDLNMISYSTDMAYIYNLPDKKGYDYNYNKRSFKWAKKNPQKVEEIKNNFVKIYKKAIL